MGVSSLPDLQFHVSSLADCRVRDHALSMNFAVKLFEGGHLHSCCWLSCLDPFALHNSSAKNWSTDTYNFWAIVRLSSVFFLFLKHTGLFPLFFFFFLFIWPRKLLCLVLIPFCKNCFILTFDISQFTTSLSLQLGFAHQLILYTDFAYCILTKAFSVISTCRHS